MACDTCAKLHSRIAALISERDDALAVAAAESEARARLEHECSTLRGSTHADTYRIDTTLRATRWLRDACR